MHFSNVRSINKILHKILKCLEEKFLRRSTKKYNNIVSVIVSNESEEVADKPYVSRLRECNKTVDLPRKLCLKLRTSRKLFKNYF